MNPPLANLTKFHSNFLVVRDLSQFLHITQSREFDQIFASIKRQSANGTNLALFSKPWNNTLVMKNMSTRKHGDFFSLAKFG